MILRQHKTNESNTTALYSDCERYRYHWLREWAPWQPRLTFILLNPSTATELATDPTVEGCYRRALAWQFGSLQVLNLFAYRATDPRDMKAAADPIGPSNDEVIISACTMRGRADVIICGWGNHGAHLNRAQAVRRLLAEHAVPLHCLRITKAGQPQHPLYIARDVMPIDMESSDA